MTDAQQLLAVLLTVAVFVVRGIGLAAVELLWKGK